jgi:hypothetical protein
MRRRAFLGAAVAGLLAGCHASGSESSPSPTPAGPFATDSGNHMVVEAAEILDISGEQSSDPPNLYPGHGHRRTVSPVWRAAASRCPQRAR